MKKPKEEPQALGGHPKQLRGSKLDAQKGAEFRMHVEGASEWDVSGWSKWTVTGRILPERCDVYLKKFTANASGSGGRQRIICQIDRSIIIAKCSFENQSPSVFQISDTIKSVLLFPVDFISYYNQASYEIILDVCINDQSGDSDIIPAYEPIFTETIPGFSFNALADTSRLEIPWSAGGVPQVATALHDITSALRYPRRTFEHCRMAVEVVRSYFDPAGVRDYRTRWRKGEESLCSALSVDRGGLVALDSVAAKSRHGELVYSIEWSSRRSALEFS
ncbi:MAG: hypothetical protein AB7K86_21530 [Rhodospirillales bacterium]